MTLQGRMIGAVMALTILTLGGALSSISLAVNRAQERQLDTALLAEARQEAGEIAAVGGDRLTISDRPGPAANDVGPLTKYGAIYDGRGAVIAETPTWSGAPPGRGALPTALDRPFDLRARAEHLRGVLVPIPGRAGLALLLAAPRTDLDGDAAFLRNAMAMVFVVACAWTLAVAVWFARRLTRGHQRIMEVAHRVAGGDLTARVDQLSSDAETLQLGRDIDETASRLATVIEAQRLFIAHAAHELRAPLTALLGEITFTLRRERDASAYREALVEALDAAEHLRAVTEDLLTLARLGSSPATEFTTVPLDVVISGATEDAAHHAQEREVSLVRTPSTLRVHGHAGDLRRLVRNLLENAARHAPRGSEVLIEATPRGDDVLLAVDDTGEGVPAEERERIFEPFYRGARTRATDERGAGLGLAIARGIARRHHGDLSCEEGRRGRGARFVLRIPAARG